MTDDASDIGDRDDKGRLWVRLGRTAQRSTLTRRQVLAGAGGTLVAGLGLVDAQSGELVGGDTAIAGGDYHVPRHDLSQSGTLQEMYVAPVPDYLPPVQNEPYLGWTPTEGPVVSASGAGSATGTIQTNMAEVHVVSDATTVSPSTTPALIVGATGGPLLVVEGTPHRRSSLGGASSELHGADDTSNLPTDAPSPSYGHAITVSGDDPNPAVYL